MRKSSIKELFKKRKKKGFTLIELIIVIAIIAILAAMAIPKFGEIRESANQKTDIATAKNIATAVAAAYADDSSLTKSASVSKTDKIGGKIDGDLSAKSKNGPINSSFSYNIDGNGNIQVGYGSTYSDSKQVYPEYKASGSSSGSSSSGS